MKKYLKPILAYVMVIVMWWSLVAALIANAMSIVKLFDETHSSPFREIRYITQFDPGTSDAYYAKQVKTYTLQIINESPTKWQLRCDQFKDNIAWVDKNDVGLEALTKNSIIYVYDTDYSYYQNISPKVLWTAPVEFWESFKHNPIGGVPIGTRYSIQEIFTKKIKATNNTTYIYMSEDKLNDVKYNYIDKGTRITTEDMGAIIEESPIDQTYVFYGSHWSIALLFSMPGLLLYICIMLCLILYAELSRQDSKKDKLNKKQEA